MWQNHHALFRSSHAGSTTTSTPDGRSRADRPSAITTVRHGHPLKQDEQRSWSEIGATGKK
jgi:hypothetical protein